MLVDVVREVHPDADVAAHGLCVDAMRTLQERPVDLAVIDLGLPDGSGTDVIRALKQERPQTEVVVATIFEDDAHLFAAMEAGASGYLLKESSRAELMDGLRGLAAGQPPLSAAVARRLVSSFHETDGADAPELSPREREVLMLIAKGLNRAEIAELLGLTRNTVAGYTKAVYRKLDVSSRAEAALEAQRLGFIRRRR